MTKINQGRRKRNTWTKKINQNQECPHFTKLQCTRHSLWTRAKHLFILILKESYMSPHPIIISFHMKPWIRKIKYLFSSLPMFSLTLLKLLSSTNSAPSKSLTNFLQLSLQPIYIFSTTKPKYMGLTKTSRLFSISNPFS